jgi:hypothetical protein
MSTRGHYIMVMEVEPDSEKKKRGRVYVCESAGTEPAGDIFALYNKITFEDGTFENQFTGPHADMKKKVEIHPKQLAALALTHFKFKEDIDGEFQDEKGGRGNQVENTLSESCSRFTV